MQSGLHDADHDFPQGGHLLYGKDSYKVDSTSKLLCDFKLTYVSGLGAVRPVRPSVNSINLIHISHDVCSMCRSRMHYGNRHSAT